MMRAMKRRYGVGYAVKLMAILAGGIWGTIATGQAKDYAVINALPKRVTAALVAGHKGWDTGSTGAMLEATYQYNEALLGMINDLAKAYYPKDLVPPKDPEEYLKALYTVRRFRHTVSPTEEDEGSLGRLAVPSEVTDDLHATITKMVQAITSSDSSFRYDKWKKQWDEALKKGNE